MAGIADGRHPIHHGNTEGTEVHGENNKSVVVLLAVLRVFRASVVNRMPTLANKQG